MRVSIDLFFGWVRNKLNTSMERIEVFINKGNPILFKENQS